MIRTELLGDDVRLLIYILAFTAWMQSAWAAESGSEVLYMDEDVNFLLLDQVASDLKDGDRLCLYHASLPLPFCEAQFRWITRKPLVFLPANMMARFQVGSRVEVKRIYVSERGPDGLTYRDATSFGRSYLGEQQDAERAQKIQTEKAEQPKLPKGNAPRLEADTPTIEGGEFPEIFIPKIRRSKPRRARDTGETAETIAAIKKALKDKGSTQYQFLPVRAELTDASDDDDNAERMDPEIPPTPLHQAVDVTILQTLPLMPVAAFQGLRYRTISAESLDRSSLWVQNKSELKAVVGAGFSLNLMQGLSRTVGFGWRYHVYDRAQSRSTYDDIQTTLEARTTTRISAQAVHGEMGWRWTLWDGLMLDMAPGLDLFYSEVKFKALNVDTTSGRAEALAFAHSSFFFVAPRFHAALRYQYRGWGVALGSMSSVPLYSFKQSFDGGAAPSERLNYSEDPGTDLNRSLTHKIQPVGVEVYLGFSYQPQRN
ncbi:hypothetical protein [Oligoflexus tunisiensis]|uniref:hypothetical protein n=1 Tax=Oligoflexus tunisiensis TaxID=708132 RepID=UPI001C404507|nr:hypothetical protein [Oligoflexus tunisiensis]